jgi:hypothetical protein
VTASSQASAGVSAAFTASTDGHRLNES